MTKYPHSATYGSTLAKLDRISVSSKHAPDLRRLASQESVMMRAAAQIPGAAAERNARMDEALESATMFLRGWGF